MEGGRWKGKVKGNGIPLSFPHLFAAFAVGKTFFVFWVAFGLFRI